MGPRAGLGTAVAENQTPAVQPVAQPLLSPVTLSAMPQRGNFHRANFMATFI